MFVPDVKILESVGVCGGGTFDSITKLEYLIFCHITTLHLPFTCLYSSSLRLALIILNALPFHPISDPYTLHFQQSHITSSTLTVWTSNQTSIRFKVIYAHDPIYWSFVSHSRVKKNVLSRPEERERVASSA